MATTQVQLFNAASVPAHLRGGELSSLAKALAGGGAAASGKRLSIKGGVFRLMVDGKEIASVEDRHLDVVIVNAASKIARTYYEGPYEEGSAKAPDCWSADGDTPDAASRSIQSPKCATCPQNIKGSGQGDSRACRFSQKLAVVLANDMEGNVMQLNLAATSIFGKAEGENRPLQAYARWLAEQNVDPGTVVTQLKFDTKVSTPKLYFKPVRWLTDAEYAVCKEQGQTEDAVKAITMTVAQVDKVSTDATPKTSLPGTPPKAAQPEQEEELAEPARRPSATRKPPATKASLSDVVSQWTDD